jgi:2-keto-4-pentenoate hydratase/2-oxohepta-3-ene-1,7-dioic acid hydratase in catechol pathway
MRLVSFPGGFGRIEGDTVVPMGDDLVRFLATGDAVEGEPVPLGGLRLLAPVPRPSKVIAVGRNYREHASETGNELPAAPTFFAKFPTSILAPDAELPMPRASDQLDYEGELAVVVGRAMLEVPAERALEHVAGYACANDLTARDLQHQVSQWTRGKALDGLCPLGPWLVTPDEVPDPQGLRLRCRVNGDVRQNASTRNMVWSVAELLATLSDGITLEPGDVVLTGTPAGIGFARTPPEFLRPGDVVEVEIERLGTLRTTIVARRV